MAIVDTVVALATLGGGRVAMVYHTEAEDDDAHYENTRETGVSHHVIVGACSIVVARLDAGMARKLAKLVDSTLHWPLFQVPRMSLHPSAVMPSAMTQLETWLSKKVPPTRSQAVEGVMTSPMNMNLAELQVKLLVNPKEYPGGECE
jgi:hypothetical protein